MRYEITSKQGRNVHRHDRTLGEKRAFRAWVRATYADVLGLSPKLEAILGRKPAKVRR